MHLLNQRPEISPPIDFNSKVYHAGCEKHSLAVIFAAISLRNDCIFYFIGSY